MPIDSITLEDISKAFAAIGNASTVTAQEAARNLAMAFGIYSTAKAMNMIIESTNESVLFRSDGTEAIKISVEFPVHDYDHNVCIFIDGGLHIEADQKDDFLLTVDEEDIEKGWYRIDVTTPAGYTIKVWRGALTMTTNEAILKGQPVMINGDTMTITGIKGNMMETIPAEYQPIYTAEYSGVVGQVCTGPGRVRIDDMYFERDPSTLDLIVTDAPDPRLIGHRVAASDIHEDETGITMNIRYEEV
jgi:hypothetical protein